MKLVNMRRSESKAKELAKGGPTTEAVAQERYPWGLRLTFDKQEIAKLDVLKNIKAGTMIAFAGVGKVTEVHVSEMIDDKQSHRNVTAQIQQIAVINDTDGLTARIERMLTTRKK